MCFDFGMGRRSWPRSPLLVLAVVALGPGVACTAQAPHRASHAVSPTTSVSPGQANGLATVGRLLCTSPGHGELVTPSVVTHADGVHFVVVNPTNQELLYEVNAVSSYRSESGDFVGAGERVH